VLIVGSVNKNTGEELLSEKFLCSVTATGGQRCKHVVAMDAAGAGGGFSFTRVNKHGRSADADLLRDSPAGRW
jgi:hypothetical protein